MFVFLIHYVFLFVFSYKATNRVYQDVPNIGQQQIFSHEKSIKEVVEMSEKLSMADEAKDFVELHELDK